MSKPEQPEVAAGGEAPPEPQELKPCPFCDNAISRSITMRATGLKVRRDDVAYIGNAPWIVLCLDCGANGANKQSRADAITAWNTRVRADTAVPESAWKEYALALQFFVDATDEEMKERGYASRNEALLAAREIELKHRLFDESTAVPSPDTERVAALDEAIAVVEKMHHQHFTEDGQTTCNIIAALTALRDGKTETK